MDFPISIHAPHTGRDFPVSTFCLISLIFQSTRPIRGATRTPESTPPARYISIHAPHTGRDQERPARDTRRENFNPRAPYGARRYRRSHCFYSECISIHAPHTGRDVVQSGQDKTGPRFQSTRPIRGATLLLRWLAVAIINFNPRAPYGARLHRR